jgi:hypothetical protein
MPQNCRLLNSYKNEVGHHRVCFDMMGECVDEISLQFLVLSSEFKVPGFPLCLVASLPSL